jgi:hypothetical protein
LTVEPSASLMTQYLPPRLLTDQGTSYTTPAVRRDDLGVHDHQLEVHLPEGFYGIERSNELQDPLQPLVLARSTANSPGMDGGIPANNLEAPVTSILTVVAHVPSCKRLTQRI